VFIFSSSRVSSFSRFFAFFQFFCRNFFIIFYTRGTFFDVLRDTEHTSHAEREEKKAAREHTHTHRKVRPRTPSRVRFRVAFLPVFILFPEEREREERFDFDSLWRPPSLRFEFCGSLSSIREISYTHVLLVDSRRGTREGRRREEVARLRARSDRGEFHFFTFFRISSQRSRARLVTFLLISTLSLTKKTSLWKVDKIK
jgi:hypothetical protein